MHDYVAKQLADLVKAKHIVVWFDPRRELSAFVRELRGKPNVAGVLDTVSPAGVSAKLVEYEGSLLQLRGAVEPLFREDAPAPLVLYVPGVERDRKTSVLMELEKAGDTWEPQLKRLARNVLRQTYTDGVIDEMLASDQVTYEDLARAAADTSARGGPSLLKAIFDTSAGTDGILVDWLAGDARDKDVTSKGATDELRKLVRSRTGLVLPEDLPLAKLRLIALRYVLAGEFRSDLRCEPPPSLAGVSSPANQAETTGIRELAQKLRALHPSIYEVAADRVESELGLGSVRLAPESLGAIDTFRFEERALLAYCGELIASRRFDEAIAVVTERDQ
ncbi:MAG TPA: PglZ domain-containing protein, partial [Polyangiaceae bacterium]